MRSKAHALLRNVYVSLHIHTNICTYTQDKQGTSRRHSYRIRKAQALLRIHAANFTSMTLSRYVHTPVRFRMYLNIYTCVYLCVFMYKYLYILYHDM